MIAKISGNSKVSGEILVSGAKNAALPILTAALLSSKKVELSRIPELADVQEMISMMRYAGVQVSFKENEVSLIVSNLKGDISGFSSKIRASILFLGPLALRTGRSKVPYPGGCSIGKRPIDIHLNGLKKLGFEVSTEKDFVEAVLTRQFKEVNVHLDFPSVGATEHLMTTASMMKGTEVTLSNCAKEPEIVDLQNFLNAMGAHIVGAGTSKIHIKGVSHFRPVHYEIIGDRIEAGTYAILAMASGGDLIVKGITPSTLNFVDDLREMGGNIAIFGNSMRIKSSDLNPFEVNTAPYPGFPTDLQPQITVLACKAKGISKITENIFESRFGHIPELKKMGANVSIVERTLKVTGPQSLHGTKLIGKDLRETAAITIAAAIADGSSEIENFEILFRGYERVVEKLNRVGVKIVVS